MAIQFINTITGDVVSVPDRHKKSWITSTTPWLEDIVGVRSGFKGQIEASTLEGLFHIIEHCKRCIRSVLLARSVKRAIEPECLDSSKLWTQMINDNYSMGVLEWCKIFGTNSEPTHWKTVLGEDKAVGENIQKACGIIKTDWDLVWQQMTDIRNIRVSHNVFDYDEILVLPDMDFIIKSCKAMYEFVLSFFSDKLGPNKELIKVKVLDIELWTSNCDKEITSMFEAPLKGVPDKNSYY
jgi:hypothetical protein